MERIRARTAAALSRLCVENCARAFIEHVSSDDRGIGESHDPPSPGLRRRISADDGQRIVLHRLVVLRKERNDHGPTGCKGERSHKSFEFAERENVLGKLPIDRSHSGISVLHGSSHTIAEESVVAGDAAIRQPFPHRCESMPLDHQRVHR